MTQPTLHIRLFGAFELRLGATPVALESVRAVSLLAYVLLRRDISHSRRSVAFQLWPDSSDAQAQTNLRHVLHTLRRSLPEGYLELTGRTLRWNPTAAWTLDVAEFDAALERAKRGNAVAELRTALAQYRAELLEGVYDEWLLPLRDEYRSRYLAALAQLATVLLEQGAYADALGVAERLLHQDPLDEVTWRLLMRLHDRQGDRARALRAYHACVTTLERELGVEPGRETKELYANLLTSEASAPVARAAMTDVLEQAPMVGRETEFARLVTAWEQSERGRARCLFLSGEAGSGKTRLVEELVAWASQRGALTAVGRAYAAEGALAYGPVVAWLRTEGLRETCRRLPEDVRHILSRLVPELAVAGVQPLPETTADDQRRRLYDAFVQALTQPERPVLLVVDDLHWSDRETLGFLHYLVRTVSQSRLLLVMIARSEELDSQPAVVELLHGLRALDRLDELELAPLSLADTLVLAERISGRTIADDEGVSLFATTEGNPLFIVESLRSGWRPGGEHPSLPPRVQAAIESRLGQVSAEARDLAGVAATIGRAFNTDVLRAAAGADEDELVRALDELWRRRIIREQDGDAYDFSHPLILEAAYRSAGPAQRRQRHARVARALERVYAADPQPVSGQIAAQYDRAAQYEQAVVWYGRAADAALRVYAHADAVHALERALALLRAHPQIPQRAERELALLTVLPGPLLGVAGYSSERLTAAQTRALELADALGRDPDPPLLRSLG
ncbi:MAG: 6-hydroxy-D-nicotine oxidase, partial [Chloroflexi bacterium]